MQESWIQRPTSLNRATYWPIEENCVHAAHVILSISIQFHHRKEVAYPYQNEVLLHMLSSSNIRQRVFISWNVKSSCALVQNSMQCGNHTVRCSPDWRSMYLLKKRLDLYTGASEDWLRVLVRLCDSQRFRDRWLARVAYVHTVGQSFSCRQCKAMHVIGCYTARWVLALWNSDHTSGS
jgi:hypothetical protein